MADGTPVEAPAGAHRLFLALPMPEAARRALRALCQGLPGARWERPDQLHLTLRFLGDTRPEPRQALIARLAAEVWPPVVVSLAGLGTFPSGGPPRALWVGVSGSRGLLDLQARLEARVVDLGFPPEPRPFRPHVTLARLKGMSRAQLDAHLAPQHTFRLGPLEVPAFGLYASRTLPEGSVHTLEALFRLGP